MSKSVWVGIASVVGIIIGVIGCQPYEMGGYPNAQQRVNRGTPYYAKQQTPQPTDQNRYTYRNTQMPAEPRPAQAVQDHLARLNAAQSPGQPQDPYASDRNVRNGYAQNGYAQDGYGQTDYGRDGYAQDPAPHTQLDQSQFRTIQSQRRPVNPNAYDQLPIDPSRTAHNDVYNETPYASLRGEPQQASRLRQTPVATHAPVPGDNNATTRQPDSRFAQSNYPEQSPVQSNVPLDLSQRGPRQAIALQGPPRLAGVTIREGQETAPNPAPQQQIARDERIENAAPESTAIARQVTQPREPLNEVLAKTEAELAARPSDPQVQWRKSMLHLAAGQEAEAGAISQELTEEQRGLLARQVAVDASVHDVLKGDRESVDRAYEAASALRDALREGADLLLPTLTLCSKVTTFGVYDELPETALKPYVENQAIVYCEIKNLAAQRDELGNYRTRLATRMELFTSAGRSMWRHTEDQIEDVARQRREDFFVAQLIKFPEDLGPGEYILKATVTDLLSSKTNEVSQNIRIGESAALTSARR